MYIANCNMKLGEKIRYLREVEGTLRGLGRAMTQQEVIDAIHKEQRSKLSDSLRIPVGPSFRRYGTAVSMR